MKRHVMAGAVALLTLPALAIAQGTAPAPRTNNAAGGVLAQTTPPTQPGAARPTAVDPAALHNGIRTSKVVGSSVYNEAKDDIGKVDDIIIPRGDGAPVAVISVGGFLGIGNRYVAVPLNDLRFQNDRWTLPRATKEYLRTLPPFTYDDTTPRR